MHPCKLCRIQCAESDLVCTFCRSRDRFWRTLDTLPVRARGWALQNLRIWTSILEEELERLGEQERAQTVAEGTATPKSGSTAVSEKQREEVVDKSWIKPKEEKKASPSTSRPGLVDLEGEGKHSSGSKVEESKSRHRSSRRRSSRRSRSRRRHHRSKSKEGRRRRRPTSSEAERKTPKKATEVEKEKKAKPSVRPPRTPSKSPPRPPKRLPVAKAKQRPTGSSWQGPVRDWKLDPAYYGVNKGVKKRERHYQGDQGGR